MLEVLDEVVQRLLVDDVFEEAHGFEVVLEEVQGFEVVFEQEVDVDFDLVQLVVVEHFLDEVLEVQGLEVVEVQGLDDEVVQCLLLDVVHGVEHEVLVQVVAGV